MWFVERDALGDIVQITDLTTGNMIRQGVDWRGDDMDDIMIYGREVEDKKGNVKYKFSQMLIENAGALTSKFFEEIAKKLNAIDVQHIWDANKE